jgi:20S proteasome subunit alpha 6
MTAQQKDREAFLKQYMYLPTSAGEEKEHNMEGVLEVLLRLVRGDRPTIGSHADPSSHHGHHHHYHHHNSANNIVHPVLQAAVGSDPTQMLNQTHTSLAVLAMFRLIQDTATRLGGEEMKREVEGRVKEIIKSLPQHMINKSLDGMFQKWLATTTAKGGPGVPLKGHR